MCVYYGFPPNNKLFFGRLEGSRITKRGFWVWFSDKSIKGDVIWHSNEFS
jgi:hypothetical protein